MKNYRFKVLFIALIIVIGTPLSSFAAGTSWTWTITDLGDLQHGTDYKRYTNWTLPADEYIVSASLAIANLNNSSELSYLPNLDNDYMNIYLLNNSWSDKSLLTTYRDTNAYKNGSWHNPSETFTYSLTDGQIGTLTTYLADTKFGLGFDPNCHYSHGTVTFTITTEKSPVPEPMTLLLLGLGLTLTTGIRTWRKRS